MLNYFAHNGVDHASTAEAAGHSDLPIILSITAVVVFALVVTAWLLSKADGKPDAPPKKGDS